MKYIIVFLFTGFFCNSQEIKLSIIVKNIEDRGIENASVIIFDKSEKNLFYDFTNEKGQLECVFKKEGLQEVFIEVNILGYKKKVINFPLTSESQNSISVYLDLNNEVLKEIVIESNQKIKIAKDTTFIKVDKFINNTEQTVEDVLKKLPGITVLSDGTIKAHGKSIDKLLIDGDDVFDKNYKLLSKNLDAKVLDEVQILDNFEDNPILKKLSDSDKVALNLKFKDGFTNVWFGNGLSGLGTEKRTKQSFNLGLLRKKVKFFYFGDYNNIGEKGSNQITENQETIDFSDSNQKIEKKTKTIYFIDSRENTQFSNSQSLFNKAFTNSLSLNTKINKTLKIRAISYFVNDIQEQNSNSFTAFNLNNNPISYTENSIYKSNKTLSSAELELKFLATDKSYITNYFVFKNNPENIRRHLLVNSDLIKENSNNKNLTFYNHLEHTYEIGENKILNNYLYFGFNEINQTATINSTFLNSFLNNLSNENVVQTAENKLQYYGLKSSIIIKNGNWLIDSRIQLHNETEILDSALNSSGDNNNINFLNNNLFKQNILSLNENLKYAFSKNTNISSNSNLTNNNLNNNSFLLLNQNIDFEFALKKIGRFKIGISYIENVPDNQLLTQNSQLNTYRSFVKGSSDIIKLNSTSYSLSYNKYNDVKRYSINASIFYFTRSKNYTTLNLIDQNFTFSNYFPFQGSDMIVSKFACTNYFRKLKLATKIETNQNFMNNPIQINSAEIKTIKNYNSEYKFSATTYFKNICNFDFGLNYFFFQSIYETNITKNDTRDLFVNVNYSINNTWVFEIKNNIYFINSDNYKFINASASYNPQNSRYSFMLVVNNLANEKNFTTQSIDSYSYFKTTINIVPQYFFISAKYRF